MVLAERKRLFHHVPNWIDPDDATFFITLCCEKKGENELCSDKTAAELFSATTYYLNEEKWYPFVMLLMPDHLHMLTSFNCRENLIEEVIRSWKRWTAKKTGVVWQRGFFDHRLRNDESKREKADYILHNPVRQNLVKEWNDWEYVWFPDR